MILPGFLIRSLVIVLFSGSVSAGESRIGCSGYFGPFDLNKAVRYSVEAIRDGSVEKYWKYLNFLADQSNPAVMLMVYPEHFAVKDLMQAELGLAFSAHVENGRLFLSVATQEGGHRSDILYGAKLYSLMMKHFEGTGAKFDSIDGYWSPESVNSQQFKEGEKRGETREAAAFGTWSGKQARKFGFTWLESFEMKEHDIHVVFSRPVMPTK